MDPVLRSQLAEGDLIAGVAVGALTVPKNLGMSRSQASRYKTVDPAEPRDGTGSVPEVKNARTTAMITGGPAGGS